MNKETWNYYIDASTSRTGIVVENQSLGITLITDLDFTHYHADKTLSKAENQFEKFKYIKEKLDGFTKKYPPSNNICIEGIFIKPAFLNSSEVVIKLHGFLMLYFITKDITFYPPKSIKKAIVGNGNASKQAVYEFVTKKYHIQCANFDQSDAFALMLYHKQQRKEKITEIIKVGD